MTPLYIDNHCHLNFDDYDADREAVIARMKEQGVGAIVVGVDRKSSEEVVALAEKHDNLYAIVGLHPIYAGGYAGREAFDYDFYKNLIQSNKKVVGIGECGFDYASMDPEDHRLQDVAFRGQVKLANELGKPLMLHLRNNRDGDLSKNAYNDALAILKTESKVPGEAHFFAGTLPQATDFLGLGYYISFTGVVTFVDAYNDLVRYIPEDRLLSETDAPYVAPVPHRGKRCEPQFVIETVKEMAEIRGIADNEADRRAFFNKLVENSRKLYGIF
ncbi:MAG: TatD family hydrolase [Patescibacteria group bacterium]